MHTDNTDESCRRPADHIRLPRALAAAAERDGPNVPELHAAVREHVHTMLGRGCSITDTVVAVKQLVMRADTPHTAQYQKFVELTVTWCIDEYYAAQGK